MKTCTAVFLLFLTAKGSSSAPSTPSPWGTCTAEPSTTTPTECQELENNCNPDANPSITGSPLGCNCQCKSIPGPYGTCTAVLSISTFDECQVLENKCIGGADAYRGSPPDCNCKCFNKFNLEEICCNTKTVGDYSYTKVSEGIVPPECLEKCIYTRDDKPGSKYCFASGEEEVHCLDKETEQIGPVGKNVTVQNLLQGGYFQIFFQHCNATGLIRVGGDKDGKTINIGSCKITKIEAGPIGRWPTCQPFVSNGTDSSDYLITGSRTGCCVVDNNITGQCSVNGTPA